MTAAAPPAVSAQESDPSIDPNPNPSASGGPCSVVPIADDYEDWSCFRDDDVMQQQSAIRSEEAAKIPFVGDKASDSSILIPFLYTDFL